MTLQLTMKPPVFFPELDPRGIPSFMKASCLAEALQAYGNALLDFNEPCMESSETAHEIILKVRKLHCGIDIRKSGHDSFILSKGKMTVNLSRGSDDQVVLSFSPSLEGINLSDFGPRDATGFIGAVFASYDRVASAARHIRS